MMKGLLMTEYTMDTETGRHITNTRNELSASHRKPPYVCDHYTYIHTHTVAVPKESTQSELPLNNNLMMSYILSTNISIQY